jgi:histidyl-tRNA synthetase
MSKPSIPEGVRDFSPEQVFKRNYLFDVIKKVFLKYGFQPIETPTMEKLSTLTGKYGEEGDQLLYKVRSNKNLIHELETKMSKEAFDEFKKAYNFSFVPKASENGLRYDLTIPFARYVVMHQNEIAFPFKRYQIQPVWRGDRPQRGRYREFYQCDVDVVGSSSLMYEAELVQIYDEVFRDLDLNVLIKVNNRKILEGIAESIGAYDKFIDMTVAIDKLDKIGWEGVEKELLQRGIVENSIEKLKQILEVKTLAPLKTFFAESEIGLKGIAELEKFHNYLDNSELTNEVAFDITLARGLNYYTGCIFEVMSKDAKMGSIGGGGRYDDLTGVFGLKGVSGVGVSFGAERIFDIMEELDKFPKENTNQVKILFASFDEASHLFAFQVVTQLRKAGINADIYPEPTKIKKQMEYANKRAFPFVAIIGEAEREANKVKLKDMKSGNEELVDVNELISKLKMN